MPRTVEIPVFKYEELPAPVQERVRNQWVQWHTEDSEWASWYVETFLEALAYLGFDVTPKDVAWSGFWNQGDGASFTGSWSPTKRKGMPTEEWLLKALGPDKEADYFLGLQVPEDFSVSITRSGRYCHKHSVSFSFDDWLEDFSAADEGEFEDKARGLMQQLYRNLEKGYEDEISEENMLAEFSDMEAEFYADGRRYP